MIFVDAGMDFYKLLFLKYKIIVELSCGGMNMFVWMYVALEKTNLHCCKQCSLSWTCVVCVYHFNSLHRIFYKHEDENEALNKYFNIDYV